MDPVVMTFSASREAGFLSNNDFQLPMGLYHMQAVLIAASADGEPIGPGNDQIVIDVRGVTTARTEAALDILFGSEEAQQGNEHSTHAYATRGESWIKDHPIRDEAELLNIPFKTHDIIAVSAGWMRVMVFVVTGFDGDTQPYAGSNDPYGTWEFTFTPMDWA
jgi:hypothetical protein